MTLATKDPKKQNMVIMGRKTWESIPEKFRPLAGRKNAILTRERKNKKILAESMNIKGTPDKYAYYCELQNSATNAKTLVEVFHSLNEAIAASRKDKTVEKIFIIGGAQIFKEALSHPDLSGIYMTKIHKTFECDTFLEKNKSENDFEKKFRCKKIAQKKEKNLKYDFLFYKKR
ncbi:dihydrofolate reductase [Candidatus Peregrinibacteria bacterium]|nr:dihydrofolate reductase [Candidatus Peregrinibacteria bacterium]